MPKQSRRKFIQSVAAAASALTASAAAAPKTAPGQAFRVLSEEQGQVLRAVLNRLIPADNEMPAAGEIGIVDYIDDAMAEATHLRQPIFDILEDVRIEGRSALECGGATLDALLERIDATREDAFDTLLQAAYTGYYSHPDVLHAIGWVPPGAEADTSETVDASLLEDVIRRGPVYRHV